MSWVFFVLIGSVFNALKNVLTRRVGNSVDVYTVAFVSSLLMLPVVWWGVWLFSEGVTIEPAFWRQMILMLPLEILVMVLFFKVLTGSRLTYSVPFGSFMPVFVAVGAFYILGEVVSLQVYFGTAIIVGGAFLLNITKDTAKADIRGIIYMLLVAAIWGYIIPMGALAVTYSSAQLFPAIYFSLATLLFIPIFLFKRTTSLDEVVRQSKTFIYIGIAFALFTLFNWHAYSVGSATGVSALGQFAVPLTSIGSVVIGGEEFNLQRFLGTLVMTVGAILVVLG